MIIRPTYLEKIKDYIDDPMIKILKGIRRSGKTELLKMTIQELLSGGIDDNQIIYMNFESFEYRSYLDYNVLYNFIIEQSNSVGKKVYIFLDEIQEVVSWEKAIRSLRVDIDCDIYITGSNANLLSSDLATLLSGRYIEIEVLPLSFSEFKVFYQDLFQDYSDSQFFSTYLKNGGFPDLINMRQKDTVVQNYLNSIYNTVVLKDVIERNNIRNPEQLKRILNYVMDNIGQLMSTSGILNYLKGTNKEKLSTTSLYSYMAALENALIIYAVPPYDVKGKKILSRSEKYYLADLGIRSSMLGYRENDISQMLENIVYLELRRRGFEIYVGKVNEYEVDFVALKQGQVHYYQVTYSMLDQKTAEREYRSLEMIPDNHNKYVLTMDTLKITGRNGIEVINIIDFLNSNTR